MSASVKLVSSIHLPNVFYWTIVMLLPPEEIIDGRKQDDRAINQNVPVHAGGVGLGRGWEKRQYEEEDQECHRDDIN